MSKGRVVVAESDRRSAGVLTWLLADHGVEASLAFPPRAVEHALEWRSPDVLLLDGDDPDLADLARRLKREQRFPDLRLIVATRTDDHGVGRVPEGADDCVEKPYRAHEVLTRVATQLRLRTELVEARAILREAKGDVERARDSSANNRRLAEVLRDVADELSASEIYRVLARRVGRALGVRHCAVILATDDDAIATVAAAMEAPGMVETTIHLDDYPEIALALSSGRSVLVGDATTDGLFADIRRRTAAAGRPFGVKSVVALPFTLDRVRGALFVRTEPEDRELTPEDVEFAELVLHAAVAAIRRGHALELSQADNKRLEELATTDPLTRLLNRRARADRLGTEMDRSRRFRTDLSVLLLDIDHFKIVNDTAGHPGGDEALRQIADLLADAVRSIDIVARFGGEEFVLILPQTGQQGARTFAERLCDRIAQNQFEAAGRNMRLTVSIGCATFPSADIVSPEDFLARADEALYRAKSEGRNQVRS
ncbi:MAG TPA: sensor domain-containing diguanylate cyclase [Gemmatimonadaceae bacterium]